MDINSEILVLGGTGFVGSHICDAIKASGLHPLVGSHRTQSRYESVFGSIADPGALTQQLKGRSISAVIYSIGLLQESRDATFADFHDSYVQNAIQLARQTGCKRFILISANGIDEADTPYALSKREGERHVMKSGLEWTIIRPSLVLGRSAGFSFATMLDLLTRSIVAPVPASTAMVQPVAASDLGMAVTLAIKTRATISKILPVCGPDVYRFSALVKRYAETAGRRVIVVPVPAALIQIASPVIRLAGLPASADQIKNARSREYFKRHKNLVRNRLQTPQRFS
ncbi:MAG: NAD dependent epimerase/dehydratase family protein [candidate division WS6 bacterium OLB20]|uniref:NAD dependent epimerase/dehydratase family protein n=1 Tax=candidate division WS6 bacterium OLB20 TaxID=1617426 RepID=A0A136LXV4_9BACT|nr:MAG: NAD dependent epimerase/dehydratase family protein [candidate division WS6 bacterium OLB20]